MSFKQFHIFCFIVLAAAFTACNDKFELPEQPLSAYTKVYMPQSVNGPKVYSFKISDTAQTMIYSANFGGQDYPAADIQVTFAVNNQLVDSFNKANGTTYAVLPEKSYEYTTSAVIPKGALSTGPLSVKVKTSGDGAIEVLKDYLLPVTISSTSAELNTAMSVAFFKVSVQPEVYDRTGWTIAGFSSEEADGEGPNNGRAVFVLDNNPSTFWHTQWKGASPGPPHYLIVDMGAAKTVHGLALTPRQSDNSGKPQELTVEASTDNQTWQAVGSFTMENTTAEQMRTLSTYTDARYIKLTITKSYNASYTHLAEFKAF